jgi:hypothetical protein
MEAVAEAIKDAFDSPRGDNYEVHRVIDCRIAYALRK